MAGRLWGDPSERPVVGGVGTVRGTVTRRSPDVYLGAIHRWAWCCKRSTAGIRTLSGRTSTATSARADRPSWCATVRGVLRRTPDRTQPPAVVSGGVDRCYWRPRRTGERSHPARRLRRAHADARPERSTPSAAASNRVRVGPGAPRSARRRGNDHWPAHQRTCRKRRVDIVRELDVARELDVDRSIDSVGVHIVTGGGHAPSPRQPTIGITAEPLRDRPPIGRGQSFNDSARRSLTTDARRVSARSSWALRLGGGCQPNVGQHDVSHHTDHDGAVGLEQHDVEY